MNRPPGHEKESAQTRRIFQELVHDGPARINALEGYRGDHEARITDTEAGKLQTQTYTERADELTVGTVGSWTEINLSSYGVEDGDVCEIWMTEQNAGHLTGVRETGSSLERKFGIENDIVNTMHVVASGANASIEVYKLTTNHDFFLVGYWRFSTT